MPYVRERPQHVTWHLTAVLVMVALGMAADAAAQRASGRTLVVPFEAGPDPRAAWLGEGVALLLADDLNGLGADAIARDERVRAFDRLQVPRLATLARGTIIKVGQLVAATTVITGRVELVDQSIAIRIRAIRIDTGRVSADFEERGQLDALLATVARAARRLAPESAVPTATVEQQHPPLPAFEYFVKGLLAETPAAQIELLGKSLTLAPQFDRARLNLSRAHADLGQWAEALATASAVAPTSPLAARAQLQAGVAEIALKRYDDAFTRLKALAERTGAPEAFNNLGVVQLRRGATSHTGRATYFFNKAVEADPSSAEFTFNLGYAYWREQDYPAAVYWLREAVRREPADSDAHFVLAAALEKTGNATEAARERELARRLSGSYEEKGQGPAPDAVPPDLERLRPYLHPPGARRTDSALLATEQREQRGLVTFHLDRARRLFDRENDREALVELRRAIYLAPYQAEAHLLIGRIHLRAGHTAEAIEALKIALWSEESAPAHVALAEAYVKAKQMDAARKEAERALEMMPGMPEAARLLEQLQ